MFLKNVFAKIRTYDILRKYLIKYVQLLNREVIRKYIENQGKSDTDYQKVYSSQLTLF